MGLDRAVNRIFRQGGVLDQVIPEVGTVVPAKARGLEVEPVDAVALVELASHVFGKVGRIGIVG